MLILALWEPPTESFTLTVQVWTLIDQLMTMKGEIQKASQIGEETGQNSSPRVFAIDTAAISNGNDNSYPTEAPSIIYRDILHGSCDIQSKIDTGMHDDPVVTKEKPQHVTHEPGRDSIAKSEDALQKMEVSLGLNISLQS